jgi:ketosteroid isomerase-like protein
MTHDNIIDQLVRSLFATWNAGDKPGFRALFADEATHRRRSEDCQQEGGLLFCTSLRRTAQQND